MLRLLDPRRRPRGRAAWTGSADPSGSASHARQPLDRGSAVVALRAPWTARRGRPPGAARSRACTLSSPGSPASPSGRDVGVPPDDVDVEVAGRARLLPELAERLAVARRGPRRAAPPCPRPAPIGCDAPRPAARGGTPRRCRRSCPAGWPRSCRRGSPARAGTRPAAGSCGVEGDGRRAGPALQGPVRGAGDHGGDVAVLDVQAEGQEPGGDLLALVVVARHALQLEEPAGHGAAIAHHVVVDLGDDGDLAAPVPALGAGAPAS